MREQETVVPGPATDSEHRQGAGAVLPTESTAVCSADVHGFTEPWLGEGGLEAWFLPSFVYVIASGRDERPVKIGVAQDIGRRISQFEAGNPYGLRELARFAVPNGIARQVETRAHKRFAEHALGREWFDVTADMVEAYLPPVCEAATAAIERFRAAILASDERRKLVVERQEEAKRRNRALLLAHANTRFR